MSQESPFLKATHINVLTDLSPSTSGNTETEKKRFQREAEPRKVRSAPDPSGTRFISFLEDFRL